MTRQLGNREYFYLLYGVFAISCACLITSLLGLVPNIPTFAFLTVIFGLYDYYFYRRLHQEKEIENNVESEQV